VIIELSVDDVDADYRWIAQVIGTAVQEPTTMPWGDRSLLFHPGDAAGRSRSSSGGGVSGSVAGGCCSDRRTPAAS
jgi:hypothetical protein